MTTTDTSLPQLTPQEKLQYRVLLADTQTKKLPLHNPFPSKEYRDYLLECNKPVHARHMQRAKYTTTHAEVTFQGELIKARISHAKDRPLDEKSHPRQPITHFSPKARKLMLETVSRIDWNAQQAVFLTLTYHQPVEDAKRCKTHLRTFLKRLYRDNGNHAVLWRIERQPKRGAWHFHLIIFGLSFIPIEDVLSDWREITGQPTITQVDIQLIKSAHKARSYVAKYCGKSEDHGLDYPTNLAERDLPGRFWGIENRALIPWAEVYKLIVGVQDTLLRFKTCARGHWHNLNRNDWAGFSLFVREIDQWIDILWYFFAGIS